MVWPAPGSKDTELGVLMGPEVDHGEADVYAGVQARGCQADLRAWRLVCAASGDLGVHQSQLRSWVKMLGDDLQHAFPGQGQMKPEQLEIARLKREVTRLKAERDILKKAAAYFAKEST